MNETIEVPRGVLDVLIYWAKEGTSCSHVPPDRRREVRAVVGHAEGLLCLKEDEKEGDPRQMELPL